MNRLTEQIEATNWQTRIETIGGIEYDVTFNADEPCPGWHDAIEPQPVEAVDVLKPRRRRTARQAATLFEGGTL